VLLRGTKTEKEKYNRSETRDSIIWPNTGMCHENDQVLKALKPYGQDGIGII
jgi:hypothetical protein